MRHGEFKLSQSAAITSYIQDCGPKYLGLELKPEEKAKDLMFYGLFDDTMTALTKIIKDPKNVGDKAKEEIIKVVDKFFTVFEGLAPSDGYVNGRGIPTAADLCMLVMFKAQTPFRGAWNSAFTDPDKYFADKFKNLPKLVDYVANTENMKEIMDSENFNGNLFDLPTDAVASNLNVLLAWSVS